jgi:hypothetical protein
MAGTEPRSAEPRSTDTGKHPPIYVTTDGDTLWLYCFDDDLDAERGVLIDSIEPGSSWWNLAKAVDRHIVEHGC